jgi:toxin ParE1/3/4
MGSRAWTVRYLPLAATDVREQVAYYKAMALGLERRFLACLRDSEQLALSNPRGFPLLDDSGLRIIVVRRFPFRLLYALRDDCILVVAVAHTAREPGQFLKRI